MGKLMIAQVDHAHGEALGHAMKELFRLGVRNAQLLSSITKKNRPGYVFLIDLPDDRVEEVAMFLGLELGIWGYHLLESSHIHFDVSFGEADLWLWDGDWTLPFTLRPKYLSKNGKLLSVKLDHDQLAEIQSHLWSWGYFYSLEFLRSVLELRFRQDPNIKEIELHLPLSAL